MWARDVDKRHFARTFMCRRSRIAVPTIPRILLALSKRRDDRQGPHRADRTESEPVSIVQNTRQKFGQLKPQKRNKTLPRGGQSG